MSRAFVPRLLLAAVAVLAVACSGDGSAGDRDAWRLVEPGTGAASAGVLSPTWPGVRRQFDDGGVTTSLGFTERWGRTVLRFQGIDDLRFFHVNDSVGVFYDGTARIGRIEPPILLVPTTVKDGMQWQTLGASGAVLGTFTVAARGEQSTLFGKLLPVPVDWVPNALNRAPVLLAGPEVLIVTTNGSGPRSLVRIVRP